MSQGRVGEKKKEQVQARLKKRGGRVSIRTGAGGDGRPLVEEEDENQMER